VYGVQLVQVGRRNTDEAEYETAAGVVTPLLSEFQPEVIAGLALRYGHMTSWTNIETLTTAVLHSQFMAVVRMRKSGHCSILLENAHA